MSLEETPAITPHLSAQQASTEARERGLHALGHAREGACLGKGAADRSVWGEGAVVKTSAKDKLRQ